MREISYSNVPPMMAAIQSGDIEALRSLLHAGYSPNAPQCYQVTIGARPREEETSPLELAVLENRLDMVRLLIESGADLTRNPAELLYGSLRGRDLTLFAFLIHAGVRIPAKQEDIYRLFLHLENRRDPAVLSLLDRLGMDLKRYGGEPLRSMASRGNQMLTEYLIQNGADINYHKPDMVFPYASTPVTEAARHNDFLMVRRLVEQGADITIPDKYGDRPYTVAVQNKNQEMAAYLKALEPEEWHNEQEKARQLTPYKLPAKLVEYLKTGPLRLEFPERELVKWADACSDCVSEQIAPVILKRLSELLDEGDTKPLEIEQLNFCFHLILGKASPKMLEVYRFLAENASRIAQLKRAPVYHGDDCTSWWITDGLRIWDATPKEKEKIPAVVLTASLIRNPDERLQALADELNERYGGSWLMPVFMKAILTQPKEQVYETYSPLLGTPKASCLLNALGMLDHRSYPDDWTFERSGPDGLRALIFWGDYSYGTYDTRFTMERYVELDERWLFDLAKDPEGRKPTVTWQTYNRGGVLYGSYDEMFISLLPRRVANPELRHVLRDYFRIRSEKVSVEESITVYKDAAKRFGGE